MKALVYTGVQEIIYREEKNPKEIPGESIVKVKASGICGSDMHAFHGKDERRSPPLILGHEVSGVVLSGKLKDKTIVLNPLINEQRNKQTYLYRHSNPHRRACLLSCVLPRTVHHVHLLLMEGDTWDAGIHAEQGEWILYLCFKHI